eukprot:c23744_g4_i3 orf=1-753(-)
MTRGHLLYASWMFSYKKNPNKALIKLFLPIIAYGLLGAVLVWGFYKLLSKFHTPYLDNFKYASIPVSAIFSVWKALATTSAYTKPISETFMESTKFVQFEHLSRIGYQHQVIDDINFLRDRMCEDIFIMPFWRISAFILNIKGGSTFLANKMAASDALIHNPLKRENFRIIVFIDNLDRQKEQLYTPLNMILKACDINAVVAIDRESVEDVIEKTKDQIDEDTQKETVYKSSQKDNESPQKDTLLQQLIQI